MALASSTQLKSNTDLSISLQQSSKYLEQILLQLKKSNLVLAERGVNGGYQLARDAKLITVYDIVRAIEGAVWEGLPEENSPFNQYWCELKVKLENHLSKNISELIVKENQTLLRYQI